MSWTPGPQRGRGHERGFARLPGAHGRQRPFHRLVLEADDVVAAERAAAALLGGRDDARVPPDGRTQRLSLRLPESRTGAALRAGLSRARGTRRRQCAAGGRRARGAGGRRPVPCLRAGRRPHRHRAQRHPGAHAASRGADRGPWLRPGNATPVPGLWLAGDWTATAVPCSMESAARSGALAAEGVAARLGRRLRLVKPPPETMGAPALLRQRGAVR